MPETLPQEDCATYVKKHLIMRLADAIATGLQKPIAKKGIRDDAPRKARKPSK